MTEQVLEQEVGLTIKRAELPPLRGIGDTPFADLVLMVDTPEPDNLDAFSQTLLKWSDGTELFLDVKGTRAMNAMARIMSGRELFDWLHDEGNTLSHVFKVID